MKKTNILLLATDKLDGTSFYRMHGPFMHLQNHHPDKINIIDGHNIDLNWITLSNIDIIVTQVPAAHHHVTIAQIAKNQGIKLWVDLDDDFFNVPMHNATYELYSRTEARQNMVDVISAADIITVSTAHLEKNLLKLNKNTKTIRNALDMGQFKNRIRKSEFQNNNLLWRGAAGHINDLLIFSSAICEAIQATTDTHWTWFGYRPWAIYNQLQQPEQKNTYYPHSDILTYYNTLLSHAPLAIHVPLHPDEFNLSKSNIAQLEGSMTGAVSIVPDWPEWQMPGAITYKTPEEYKEALLAVAKGEVDVKKESEKSWNHIKVNCTLEKANDKRLRIVEELMSTK